MRSRRSDNFLHVFQFGLMVACGLIGPVMAFTVLTYSAPHYFGWIRGELPDPDRPGHFKNVSISTPELLAQTGIATVCIITALFLWRLTFKKR